MKRAVGGAAHSLAWIPASIQKMGLFETSIEGTTCWRPYVWRPVEASFRAPIRIILSGLPSDDFPITAVDANRG